MVVGAGHGLGPVSSPSPGGAHGIAKAGTLLPVLGLSSPSKARWFSPCTVHSTQGQVPPRAALGAGEV